MIYAYTCEGCGAGFTVRATVAEKTLGLDLLCPECGATEARQDFRGVGVLVGRGSALRGGASLASGCSPGGGCC